jgi:hypothetical protein
MKDVRSVQFRSYLLSPSILFVRSRLNNPSLGIASCLFYKFTFETAFVEPEDLSKGMLDFQDRSKRTRYTETEQNNLLQSRLQCREPPSRDIHNSNQSTKC